MNPSFSGSWDYFQLTGVEFFRIGPLGAEKRGENDEGAWLPERAT